MLIVADKIMKFAEDVRVRANSHRLYYGGHGIPTSWKSSFKLKWGYGYGGLYTDNSTLRNLVQYLEIFDTWYIVMLLIIFYGSYISVNYQQFVWYLEMCCSIILIAAS